MKNNLLILLAALMCACTTGRKYEISGIWPGGDGQTVYLKKQIDKDNYASVDSAVVSDGVFSMNGSVPEIDLYTIEVDGKKEKVILDEQPITVTVTPEEHVNRKGETVKSNDVVVSGSAEQEILRQADALALGKNLYSLGAMFMMADVKDDPAKLDSVYQATEMMKQAMDDNIRNFHDSLNDSYAITYSIADFISREYPFEDVVRYYDNLTPRVRESYPGRLLGEQVEALRNINVGGIAPDIDLPAPDGRNIKLSSLRGKYVLLDFWASWCGPCLREVPNVKAIYEDYKDKGFEIYGVSLDDEKQRGAWLEKIDEYGMDWVHVSSLKGWECPTAAQYNVTGIPKMYLLDREGRIIAMDLRGEELRNKVASLFE